MASTGEVWRLGRRPALDGLRGLAILLVLACHTEVPHMWGAGAVGVTVFFTLSGFLITALLLEEHARAGRISLHRFYARRMRRLGPAFAVTTALVVVFGVAVGSSWFFTWDDLWPVLLYVGNFPLAAGHAPHALAGTWSLSVEEQFYLVWPLAVIVALRRGGPRMVGVAAAGVLAGSLGVRVLMFLGGASDTAVYYGTIPTASALTVGALLATALHRHGPGTRSLPAWLPLGAVALLAASEGTARSWWFIAPVGAAAATVLLLHRAAAMPPAWLDHAVLRWFGTRSYALYLLHAPLAWVLRERTDLAWWAIVAVVLPISAVLAECSWRWIEAPTRATTGASEQPPRLREHVSLAVQ